jgi:hypothetical protein
MRRKVTIELPDSPLFIYPVPRGLLEDPFLELLKLLQKEWVKMDVDAMLSDAYCLGILKALLPLLPTYPQGLLTIETLQANTTLFKQLFVGIGMEKPLLVTLHDYKAIERKPRPADAPLSLRDVPFESSGDATIDLLADLIHSTESVEQATTILNTFDAESLDKLFFRLEQHSDRSHDPDGVLEDFINDKFDKWIDENREEYDRVVFSQLAHARKVPPSPDNIEPPINANDLNRSQSFLADPMTF